MCTSGIISHCSYIAGDYLKVTLCIMFTLAIYMGGIAQLGEQQTEVICSGGPRFNLGFPHSFCFWTLQFSSPWTQRNGVERTLKRRRKRAVTNL